MALLKTDLVTGPSAEPLKMGDIKNHLRIEEGETAEDELLKRLRATARQRVEKITNRKLITQTWKAYYDEWPSGDAIVLPYTPLSTGTAPSITYVDSTAGSNTFSTTGWRSDSVTEPPRLVLTYSQSWPSASLDNMNPIYAQFVCGYGNTSTSVPEEIKSAMLLMVGHLYENRETHLVGRTINAIPDSLDALLASYRVWNM
jgi:uncharacterized phiE125 gp8 family phage protein